MSKQRARAAFEVPLRCLRFAHLACGRAPIARLPIARSRCLRGAAQTLPAVEAYKSMRRAELHKDSCMACRLQLLSHVVPMLAWERTRECVLTDWNAAVPGLAVSGFRCAVCLLYPP